MFAVLARPIQRRAIVYGTRWMSQISPSSTSGAPSSTNAPKDPKPDTPEAEVVSESTSEPVSSLPSLDFSPVSGKQTTGARSSKGTLSASEKRRQHMGKVSAVLFGVAFGLGVFYQGREWEEDELKAKKLAGKPELAPQGRWNRTKERCGDLFDFFNKPAWEELLPPPYPPSLQKPYTLLISIDDLLVTSTWDRQHGWRTAKRPGVDYFLAYISQFYEVVIFTSQNYYTAIPILEKLDKYNFFITHRLFREATRSLNGNVVKDLSYLNRDLSKVVALDTDASHYATHPENALILPKWKGEPGDKGLIAMIPFLESIAIYKPADVRPIIEAYHGKDIPLEYGKKEAEAKAKHIEEWKKRGNHLSSSSFSSMFGLSQTPAVPRGQPPPTYLEQKRTEAQRQYLEEQKYIESNRETLDKMLEQEQQAMMSQGPGSLFEVFSGQPKPRPEGDLALPPSNPAPTPTSTKDSAGKA